MVVAFAAAAVVLLVLVADLVSPRFRERRRRHRTARASQSRAQAAVVQDPGRELRAEQKARALLRSCVNEEEWEMYRDLGFIRVRGSATGRFDDRHPVAARLDARRAAPQAAYLVYPHRPIVAFEPNTHRLVGEYCVTFEDHSRPYGSSRLPDADDVLAKWMALRGDEHTVISMANMHLPGRQVPLELLQRDLRRLAQWDRAHLGDDADLGDPLQIGRAGQAGQHTAAAG